MKQTNKQTIKLLINEEIRRVISEYEYDEWRNTRIQSKNIFRILKQKYKNNIADMKIGLEDVLKQNNTKKEQASVMWDEFNKYFKLTPTK